MEHKRNILIRFICYVSGIPFGFGCGLPMPYMTLAYMTYLLGKAILKGYIHQIVQIGEGINEESLY